MSPLVEAVALLCGVALLAGVIWGLSRVRALRCPECGQPVGSNDDCEGCVDHRAFP
jgi:hypothetical protein